VARKAARNAFFPAWHITRFPAYFYFMGKEKSKEHLIFSMRML
jgi:hypothetical protein